MKPAIFGNYNLFSKKCFFLKNHHKIRKYIFMIGAKLKEIKLYNKIFNIISIIEIIKWIPQIFGILTLISKKCFFLKNHHKIRKYIFMIGAKLKEIKLYNKIFNIISIIEIIKWIPQIFGILTLISKNRFSEKSL